MTVVVLGAGAVGVATAWYLAKAGLDVTVIERQDAAALETSWGNGGVIHASEVEPWSQPGMPQKVIGWLGQENAPLLLRFGAIPHMWRWGLAFARNCTPARAAANSRANLDLALYSLRSLQEIGAEAGIDYDRATRGVLKIYRSPAALDAAQHGFEELAKHGLMFERTDVARAVALEPALAATAATLTGALYFPRDEVGDCNKFTQGLAAACAARGVKFMYGTTVQRLDLEGGKVTGVITDRGRIAADDVVAALGSFTAPLLNAVGARIPIYPVKGLSITFPGAAEWAGAPRLPVIDDSKLFALVPIGDRLRISGSAEITGYDATPAMSRAEAILANTRFTFPQVAARFDLATAKVWAGLRPVSPAGTPIIGKSGLPGLWINSGHGHLGWTLACGSGRLLADLLVGRAPAIRPADGQGALAA